MKTIIGTDLGGSYRQAAALCAKLDIGGQAFSFVNAIEPMPSTGWFAPTGYVPPAWQTELETAGHAVVERAVAEYCRQKFSCEGKVVFGSAAEALIEDAEAEQADFIAIGSSHKSRLETALLGSVGRALTVGTRFPVLIAREEKLPASRLTAVLATDHSPYADKIVDRLIEWQPQGVEKIHLVTALNAQEWAKDVVRKVLPQSGENPEEWVAKEMSDRSEAVARKLRNNGYAVHVHVLKGHPNDVLHHTMHGFGADLLILGGQGHGFIERLMVGSVALHQAVAETYSVLIMRP